MWWNRKKKISDFEDKTKSDIVETKTEEPKSDVKVRVEPYDNRNKFYTISYSYNGVMWKTLVRNMLSEHIDLCDQEHPVLIDDFDEAVKVALSLTKEKIENDIMINKQKFDSHILELREKIEKRNKTFNN